MFIILFYLNDQSINPYLGAGSDYVAFVQKAAIPAIDQLYIRNKVRFILKRFHYF